MVLKLNRRWLNMSVQTTKLDFLLQRLKEAVKENQNSPDFELMKEFLDLFSHSTRLNIGGSDVIVLDNRVSIKDPQEIFSSLTSSSVSVEESKEEDTQFVTTKEVADFFHVTQETVREWISKGLLIGIQNVKRGKILIPKNEFEFIKQKKQQGDTVHNQLMDRWFGEKKEEWEIDYSNEDFKI